MKVAITESAQRDLAAIGDFIRADNPARAVSFLKELRQSCEELGSAPHAFPIVPRYGHLAIRRRVHRAYLIFYRVSNDQVDVLHVVHGRRDLDSLLFGDEADRGF